MQWMFRQSGRLVTFRRVQVRYKRPIVGHVTHASYSSIELT